MNIRFKNRCFHVFFITLILLIVIFLANYFSFLTHTWVNNTQNSIVRRILNANDIQEVIAFNENTISVAKEYSFALLETVITSNEFPDFNSNTFLAIVSSIPEKTKIENFTFSVDRLVINCVSENSSDYAEFFESVSNQVECSEIIKSELTEKEEKYHFFITIIF